MFERPPANELPIVYVCQARMCRRIDTPRFFVHKWWLIAPRRDNPNYLVIRCPEHYTSWALRQTIYGRLEALEKHAARARKLKLPPVTGLEPIPAFFLGAERYGLQDDEPVLNGTVVSHVNRRRWSWQYPPTVKEKIRGRRKTVAQRGKYGMFQKSPRRRM